MTTDPILDLRSLGDLAPDERDRPIGAGTFAARPAANMVKVNSFYYATDTNVLYFSNGIAWTQISTPGGAQTYGTSLPGSPTDGQVHVLVDSATASTWQWTMRYNSARATNKWECIGSVPMTATSDGSAGAAGASTVWTNYASDTIACRLNLTYAGDYVAIVGARSDGNAASAFSHCGFSINGADPTDTNQGITLSWNVSVEAQKQIQFTLSAAGQYVRLMHRDDDSGRRISCSVRQLMVFPRFISS